MRRPSAAPSAASAEHQRVGGLEHRLVFHPQRGEVVDVEEAPVVDLVRGHAPVREPVVPAPRAAACSASRRRRPFSSPSAASMARATSGCMRARRSRRPLSAGASPAGLAAERGSRIAASSSTAARVAALRGKRALDQGQDRGILARRRPGSGARDSAPRSCRRRAPRRAPARRARDDAVVLAQHRHQHLALELAVDRVPVDVEIAGVGRGLAVLQHVHPPGVVGAHDAHVVRHHVEQLTHVLRAQRGDEALEALAPAELGVDLRCGRRRRSRARCRGARAGYGEQ